MRGLLALACLAILAAGAPARAQDATTRIIEVIGERPTKEREPSGAAIVTVRRLKTCGTRENRHLCGTITRTQSAASLRLETPGIRVTADKGASVIVTWSGNLYCQMKTGDAQKIEFTVDLAIRDGQADAIDLNEEGSTRIGTRRRPGRDYADGAEAAFDHYPVTLTRTFVKRKTSSELYAVLAVADVEAGSVACDVGGGAMTAVVVNE